MKTYLRILSYVKPYWKHLVFSIIATVLSALLNGASVYLAIPLLDTLFQASAASQTVPQTTTDPAAAEILPGWFSQFMNDISQTFQNFIFSGSEVESLFKICTLILFAFLGKNLFSYLQAYFLAFVQQGVIKDMRDEAYVHLHKLPMSFFKNEKTGNLISKITNDVNVIQASVSAVFFNLVREPVTILVFLGIAMSISLHLTLLSFVILPVSAGIISWIGLKLRKQSGILQSKMADITNILQETITGVKIVKAFGMEDYENRKFKKETNKFFKLSLRMVRVRNAASPITEFLSVIVGVVIIFYGGQLVLLDGSMRTSEFLTFLFAIFQLIPPIKELSSVNNRIQESSAAADRVFEILDTEPNIKSEPDAISKTDFTDSINFINVGYRYEDSEEDVLSDINFEVKRGDIIALVGSSGAGKTTLVDLLPRFYDPTVGQIKIDGVDIRKIKLEDLRKMMGIVTQEIVLFNETVANNIAYGSNDVKLNEIINAAKAANAHDFILNLPKSYNTIIGERGTKLSGGQRQRISIARALLKNPPIMIFDEATSALDNESEILVQEAIDRLMYQRTTFVIAHRLSTIRNATRILVLDKGKIVQDGKHEDLIKDSTGIYKRLYEMQFR